jgi:hypothetical protein
VRRKEVSSATGRISELEERIGDRESLLGCLAMGVLLFRLGKDHPSFDKKLLRQLLDLHSQVHILDDQKAHSSREF